MRRECTAARSKAVEGGDSGIRRKEGDADRREHSGGVDEGRGGRDDEDVR